MGEIFEFILFELQCTDFSKIFSGRRGVDPLSTGEFLGESIRQKKLSKLFRIFWGTLNLRRYPNLTKAYGDSIEGVEIYLVVKRFLLYVSPNSRYKCSNFDLLGPLVA